MNEQISTESSYPSESALIVGSGIAGMCTAMALGKAGFNVTVLERDTAPPEGDADQAFFDWPRRGASQFRHPHAFLGLMCNLLQDNYPDLLEDFYAAGARRMEFADMLPIELQPRYKAEPGDEKLWVMLCRRATIETVLRRYVESLGNVRIINNLTIDGITVKPDSVPLQVTGVKVRRDCQDEHGEVINADVIIDASGRGSKFPAWLSAYGVQPEEENEDAEIVYYTRHYQLKEGAAEPPRDSEDRANGDLGYLKYGVFPGDNGSFAVIVCTHNDETELREAIKDGKKFDAICRSIPGLAPWVDPDKASATTPSFGIGNIRAIWRHYTVPLPEGSSKQEVDAQPLTHNFFAVGDASIRTNPLYGRGCSTGILHAHMLAQTLTTEHDATARALKFNALSEERIRPIYETSLSEDRNGIRRAQAVIKGETLDRADTFKKWFGLAFGDALAAAARYDLHVIRGVMRTVNLLEKPGEFLNDTRTRLTILAYMLRGRKKNAAARMQRGLSRDEMLDALLAE